MSGISISIRPHLSESMKETIGLISPEPKFGYEDLNGEYIELETSDEFFHSLYDGHGIWTPDSDTDLIISGQVLLHDTSILFGPEGIAPFNSKIGIGIRWCSNQSRKRGTIPVTVITKENCLETFSYDYRFPQKYLRGLVEFSTIFYIACPGTPGEDEINLANTQGEIIGETLPYKLSIDGTTPDINIVWDEDHPTNPLWWILGVTSNPLEDPFDANALTIYLNKLHPSAKYINKDDRRNYCAPFFLEVISNAMCLFFEKLRAQEGENLGHILNEEFDEGQKPVQGTIADNVLKFRDQLGLDLGTPESTAIAVRLFVEHKLSKL